MRGPAGTLPRRCRHDAIPSGPARQETPGTFGTQSVPIGLATQHDELLANHRGHPEGPPRCPSSHASPSKISNLGADSRRIERVATLGAEQHTNSSATEPNATSSRVVRAEARSRRSPALLGGLDASADTTRRRCDRRLDTTVHPHEVETDGVATTAPTGATQETLGLR